MRDSPLQTDPARLPEEEGNPNGAARAGGFSLHAGIYIEPTQRGKVERLCRYVSRAPVGVDRIESSLHQVSLVARGTAAFRSRASCRTGVAPRPAPDSSWLPAARNQRRGCSGSRRHYRTGDSSRAQPSHYPKGCDSQGPQNGLCKHASAYGAGTPILRIDSFYDGLTKPMAGWRRVTADSTGPMGQWTARRSDSRARWAAFESAALRVRCAVDVTASTS